MLIFLLSTSIVLEGFFINNLFIYYFVNNLLIFFFNFPIELEGFLSIDLASFFSRFFY